MNKTEIAPSETRKSQLSSIQFVLEVVGVSPARTGLSHGRPTPVRDPEAVPAPRIPLRELRPFRFRHRLRMAAAVFRCCSGPPRRPRSRSRLPIRTIACHPVPTLLAGVIGLRARALQERIPRSRDVDGNTSRTWLQGQMVRPPAESGGRGPYQREKRPGADGVFLTGRIFRQLFCRGRLPKNQAPDDSWCFVHRAQTLRNSNLFPA